MNKFFLSFFFSVVTICSQAQNNNIAFFDMLQNAKDSIEQNKINGASKILSDLLAYGVHTDSVLYWHDKMREKGIALSYELYKNRQFDLSLQYIRYVVDENSLDLYYWTNNAKNMSVVKQAAATVTLALMVSSFSNYVVQNVRRKISKDAYVKILQGVRRDDAESLENFLYAYKDSTLNKWGFSDSQNILLIPCEYDEIVCPFKADIAIVKKNGIYGFLHSSGISTFDNEGVTDKSVLGYDTRNNKLLNAKEIMELIQTEITY